MNRRMIRWIVIALVVLALLGGAYRITERRNEVFFSSGGDAATMPMH